MLVCIYYAISDEQKLNKPAITIDDIYYRFLTRSTSITNQISQVTLMQYLTGYCDKSNPIYNIFTLSTSRFQRYSKPEVGITKYFFIMLTKIKICSTMVPRNISSF